jgi:hypothetical protein
MVIRVRGGGNFPIWDWGFRLGFALEGVPLGCFVKSGEVVWNDGDAGWVF